MHSPWSQQGQPQRQNNKTSITLYRSGGTQSWTTILYMEEPWPASADSSNNYLLDLHEFFYQQQSWLPDVC